MQKKDHIKISSNDNLFYIIPSQSGLHCKLFDQQGEQLLTVKTNEFGQIDRYLPRNGSISVYIDGEYNFETRYKSLRKVQFVIEDFFQVDRDFVVQDGNSEESDENNNSEHSGDYPNDCDCDYDCDCECDPWDSSCGYNDDEDEESEVMECDFNSFSEGDREPQQKKFKQ